VARADTVTGVGARSTLAARALVSLEATASSGGTVADTLVGALHVVMGSVGTDGLIRVSHGRELLGGSVRIDGIVDDDISTGARKRRTRGIQISLGGIDVSQTKLADTLRAIICHPVTVAGAHVVLTTFSVAAACIGAFSNHLCNKGE
jgi:hypothetical protein